MSDDSKPRSVLGRLDDRAGNVRPARFYFEANEAVPTQESIHAATHETWTEHDGTIGLRRGRGATVGARATYSAAYDQVDWGN